MYLNEFHRQSTERCLQINAQLRSLQINCEEEVQKIKQMHDEIDRRYPKGN